MKNIITLLSLLAISWTVSAGAQAATLSLSPTETAKLNRVKIDKDFGFDDATQTPRIPIDMHCDDQNITCQSEELIRSIFKIDIEDNQKHTFPHGKVFSIFSHTDSGFDTDKVAFPGVKKLLSFSIQMDIPRLASVSPGAVYGFGTEPFQPKHMNYVMMSFGGGHNLSFSQTRVFLISGGNTSLCLCEFLRDAITGTKTPAIPGPTRFILVSDAIYDVASTWPAALPPLPGADEAEPEEPLQFLLDELMQKTINQRSLLASYFEQHVLGLGQSFCPGQNTTNQPALNPDDFIFDIYVREKNGFQKIKNIGARGRHIEFILTPAKGLVETFKKFSIEI